jgi:psp operon transcriptional activator
MNTSLPNIDALGHSEAWLNFQERLSRAAVVNRPVLLIGERGVGKELAARRLHYLSTRWSEPLVALNCAALAPSLIESELFGYEPGAFTGAGARRRGRFESAEGGTLFLDELGNIPLEVQEKILRVVEYGSFERVGGSEAVQVDVRIVGATNNDLPARAASGKFMSDLLDRLSFEVLYLPPLRARREDVLLLANHFAARMAAELGREDIPQFSNEALDALENYTWPGNVRELKNVVERAVYRANGAVITDLCFDPFVCPYGELARTEEPEEEQKSVESSVTVNAHQDFKTAVAAYEASLVKNALESCQFNQRKAAKLLGLSYHQFRGLYRKYGAEK